MGKAVVECKHKKLINLNYKKKSTKKKIIIKLIVNFYF